MTRQLVRSCLSWYYALIIFALANGVACFFVEASAPRAVDAVSCGAHYGNPELASAEDAILNFLDKNQSPEQRYRIQGWRWHTMSLIRDSRRLGRLASRLASQNATVISQDLTLEKAVYHVVDFNMKALHRIENEYFFPWLRKKLTATGDSNLDSAFSTVLDEVIAEQRATSELGMALKKLATRSSETSETERIDAVLRTSGLSNDLSSRIKANLEREDKFLVPAIAVLVSDSEQRSFNSKIIRILGIFDSRLHLVGMYEAVQEQDETERRLFREEMPSVPQYMIRRWKRKLYDPQAGLLEELQ